MIVQPSSRVNSLWELYCCWLLSCLLTPQIAIFPLCLPQQFKAMQSTATPPPWQANVKTGPSSTWYLLFIWYSVSCYFAFLGVLVGDFGFWYSHPQPDSLLFFNFFQSVGLASGLPSAKFPLLALANKS